MTNSKYYMNKANYFHVYVYIYIKFPCEYMWNKWETIYLQAYERLTSTDKYFLKPVLLRK